MSEKDKEFGDSGRENRPRRDGQRPQGEGRSSSRSNSSSPQRSGRSGPPKGERPGQGRSDWSGERSGERRPYGDRAPRDGEKREWKPREGGRPARDSERRPYGDRPARPARDGERKPWGDRPRRDGDRPERPARDGERRSYGDRPSRDGERRPYGDRAPRDGEKREWKPREGGRPSRDGERREFKPRDGERKLWGDKPRDGERRPYSDRPRRDDGPRKQFGDRPRPNERGERDERPELTPEQLRARELRMVRPRHDDPEIDPDVTESMLDRVALNELKTLTKENAEFCALHLVMAARLIDLDPELAHKHATSASRRGGRIGIIRETLAITAYASGDFALALRELRTYRRISGSNEQIALMVDSERGIGRPDRALELSRSVDRSSLSEPTQVALAIAMSGARLDLDQVDLALAELEIPQLDPKMAFSYSPALFRAYAEVLEELGRHHEAADWIGCAEIAERALEEAHPELDEDQDDIIVFEEELAEGEFDDDSAEAGDIDPIDAADFDEEALTDDEAAELLSAAADVVEGADPLELGRDDEPVDLDVLEDDVRQILEETKHLDGKNG